MKIQLYVKSGDNPREIARIAQSIVESSTGKSCNVRITGTGMVSAKKNSIIEEMDLPTYRGN